MTTPGFRQAAERYGLTPPDLKLLSSSESGNRVYGYQQGQQEFVLKLIPHSNKDKQVVKNQLESELDWINYLADHGINTPRGMISPRGNLVELIELDHEIFLSLVAFEKAPGRPLTPDDFEASLFAKIGRLSGKIHTLAQEYQPGPHLHKRPEWDEDEYLDIDRLLPATDSTLVEKSWELVNSLKNLPRRSGSYGLVHGDLQEHNLHLNNGEIIILDFESSIYCWYIFDFVASLEAVTGHLPFGVEMDNLTRYFSENYWQGYREENQIDPFYLQKVPEFFRLWELLLYSEFINEWDMAHLSEKRRHLLNNYRSDIINGYRFRNIQFERFYEIER